MKCDKLFDEIDELEQEYIEFLTDICNIESPSDCKEGVDKVSEYICSKAEKLGWKIEKQKQEVSGDCVCITMNSESPEEAICFSGHMDTVHPIGLFGYPPARREADKLYGPGSIDCKGGIASAFMAMHALSNCGFDTRPVKLILQSDEEVSSSFSSKTTVDFMSEQARGCVAFLNCEGYSKYNATLERKGISKYTFEIIGKSAHAGVCYSGINAILEASYKIMELEKFKNPDGITINCGTIKGGTKENTVPETCVFSIDSRFKTMAEMNEIDAIVNDIASKSYVEGAKCILTLKSRRVSMERNDVNFALLQDMNKIYQENNLPLLKPASSNGGSDASDISARGIPCVDSLGVEGGGVHSKNEFMYISSLTESAKRLAAVAYCI